MRVIELFAGVGGFRIGLERVDKTFYQFIWSNQFEPSTKRQHASEVYIRNFGSNNHVTKDISLILTKDIPNHDILCAGFPCQDYSVARIRSQSQGILGKKGVLWWEIERIVREKGEDAPSILILENVDRLLQSPATQRGRDFAIILQSLSNLGYVVEWRVINAADYGMPQRRRRTYILAYRKDTPIFNSITSPISWLVSDGILATAFPVSLSSCPSVIPFRLKGYDDDLYELCQNFNSDNRLRPFSNSGIMMDGKVWTLDLSPSYEGPFSNLGDVLLRGIEHISVSDEFYINDADLPKWRYFKGAKHETRKTKDGVEFSYTEGSMSFPDPLDKPSRTIITSEGGASPSRFKHVILDPENGRLRRLVPIELERLNMFPDNHTAGQSDSKRAFFMGNALVCGVITKIGHVIYNRLANL